MSLKAQTRKSAQRVIYLPVDGQARPNYVSVIGSSHSCNRLKLLWAVNCSATTAIAA